MIATVVLISLFAVPFCIGLGAMGGAVHDWLIAARRRRLDRLRRARLGLRL